MGLKKKRKVSVVPRGDRFVVEYRDDNGKRPRPAYDTAEEAAKEKERIELQFAGFVPIAEVKATAQAEPAEIAFDAISLKNAIKKFRDVTGAGRVGKTKGVEKLHFVYLWEWLTYEKQIEQLQDVKLIHLEEFQAVLLTCGTRFLDREKPVEDRKRRRERLAGSTVNRMFATYTAFFRKCVAWKLIRESENPIKGLKDANETPVDIRPWTKEQIQIAAEELPLWAYKMEFFLADTGRRPIDAERQNWGDVNLEHRQFRVVTYKGGRAFESWFPISDRLHEFYLREKDLARRKFRAGSDQPVFLNSFGQRATASALIQAFRKARVRRPELAGLTLYGMRHAFIDGLIDAGVHPRDAQLLAGHRRWETTLRYTHRKQDHLRAIVTAASDKRQVRA